MRPVKPAPTLQRIVEAAGRLFLRDGYRRTTIGAIAEEAGVAIQTIYNVAGPKAALLNLVLDAAASGPEAPTPVRELMQRRAGQVPDSYGLVSLLADWFAEVHPRTAGVFAVIREAGAVDPEIAKLEVRRDSQRYQNYILAAQKLSTRGGLRPAFATEPQGEDEMAAIIWAIGHPRVYRQLVGELGWSLSRYRSWVERSLGGLLIEGTGEP